MLIINIGKPESYASIIVFVNHDNKILLLKRKLGDHIPYGGKWGLVGGGSDKGEWPSKTAVREAYEETGLKVVPSNLIKIAKTKSPDDRDIHVYACKDFEGKVSMKQVKDEHDDYRWVDVEDIEEYDTPDNTANFVKKAVSLF